MLKYLIILHKLSQRNRRGNTCQLIQNYPDTKPDKDITRKLQTNLPDEYRHKNPPKNTDKLGAKMSKLPIIN